MSILVNANAQTMAKIMDLSDRRLKNFEKFVLS